MTERVATVVVIGAGQAGLSAAFHLKRRGFSSALADPTGARTFVVLDADDAPGGAWQHRWESLRMATVNGIFDLPGLPKPPIDAADASRDAVPRYFAAYEKEFGFPILRPVRVAAVRRDDDDPEGDLLVETSAGVWRTRAVINATGTWTNPRLPHYPGAESFRGRQLHTRDYVSNQEFAGQRVAVVGGGISAVQQLEEISRVATTFWYTRREPVFLEHGFEPETTGRSTIEKVVADVSAGRPTGSVVSYTGLGWTSYAIAARDRGALERRPMFTAIEPTGVREADGSVTPVDAILWATGFTAAVSHLDPLDLRGPLGGIPLDGTRSASDPRVHLIGFGPSQSTVGANRAGRDAVATLLRTVLREPADA
jgi:cation diffusion facilitator CzcD-associated flavoprotein CzcO